MAERLIDAEALEKKAVMVEALDGDGVPYEFLAVPLVTLETAPTIEAKPVVHAHWSEVQCSKNSVKWLHRVSCSNCHNEGHKRYDYCPHCGAQMDEFATDTNVGSKTDHIAEGGKKEGE